MTPTILEVNDVSLRYHELSGETVAIDKLSFNVKKGEFISIVGPSGCGKTSILSLLSGLITPSEGSIAIDAAAAPGYMLQKDHLLDWRTIEGNVLLGLEVKGMLNERTRAKAFELLDTYGLSEFRTCHPRQLSGGMRQKVALIRTLAVAPEVLLLDEPFSSLDYQTRLRLANEIHEIIQREKKTAVLVTHDISEAISMSDRVLVFTKRPARLKAVHDIRLTLSGTADGRSDPLTRRGAPEFKDYFDLIWRELDDEKTN